VRSVRDAEHAGWQEILVFADDGLERARAVRLRARADVADPGRERLPDRLLELMRDVPELVGGVVAVEGGEPFGVGGEERREGGDVPGFGGSAEVAFLADEQRPAR
jgi:hypothetical protein